MMSIAVRIALSLAVLAGATTCYTLNQPKKELTESERKVGSILPAASQEWVPVEEFTDEFNGIALDLKKWHTGNPDGWKGHAPAEFRDENVEVKDGMLQITARAEPEGGPVRFTTGSIFSRNRIRYGYFEARCKMMPSHASSAFWLFRNSPEAWTELDIFEEAAVAGPHFGKLYTNARMFHDATHPPKNDGGDPVQDDHPHAFDTKLDLAADFHIYGMKWDGDWIAFYFDGNLVRSVANKHWTHPLHVLFDSEIFEGWFGLPDAAELPATFQVDYVRTWQLGTAESVSEPPMNPPILPTPQ